MTILLAAVLTAGGGYFSDTDIQAKRNKARTSQTSKRSKKKRHKSSRKSKKRNSKRNGARRTARRASTPAQVPETPSYDSLTLAVNTAVIESLPSNMNPGGLRVNSVKPDMRQRITNVSLNENFTYLPVSRQFIDDLGTNVRQILPDSVSSFPVNFRVGSRPLSYYITKVDKLPPEHRRNEPFVRPAEPYVDATHGMEGDIVAMWHSHGRYFKNGGWQWQRPLLFGTVEDTYTMGYILPYVVPMLENAGAYVMLPRERDTNIHEVIVDNDVNEGGEIYSQPYYREMNGACRWQTGEGEGFIYDLKDFRDTENPFENGTYRQVQTVKGGKPSAAAWYADIPADGEYAVYVSYKTLPNSSKDARYTVNYSGGSKEFRVNQSMGGGTWIYLGTFPLRAGYSDTEPVVTLTNLTDGHAGSIVTADAVKIGGGMGNIARSSSRRDIYYDPSTPDTSLPEEGDDDEDTDEDADISDDESVDGEPAGNDQTAPQEPVLQTGRAPVFRTSGMPRYLEGARYWMHWAGAPESVYSPYHGTNDYKDDYTSRGQWVNWLAGGSRVLPGRQGLGIPVDVTMALHSDAGKRSDDSFVGTLGIYFTNNGDNYADGTPRTNSRMLTDLLMRQITNDIRQTYEPRWTRRSMWDKSYLEARVPEVPTALIELMSHQNFADMQYGLDPAFRFTVGRAIYKALARFVSERKDRELVIHPLPVHDFAIERRKRNHYRLSWKATEDVLEPTATPKKYIILGRSGNAMGFTKIGETTSTHYDVKVDDHDIHSFRVLAANSGGVSFPSETLAFRECPTDKSPILIVNGFTRVSGPAHFSDGNSAGFRSEEDFGVPYINDISFTGHQTEFRRSAGESFGRSGSNYASKVIAGNSFDYPVVHGRAAADAGYGFVSASAGAVENGTVSLDNHDIVDLILGKQKTTVIGNGKSGVRHKAFSDGMQRRISDYLDNGGSLLASGQYIISDLTGPESSPQDSIFAAEVLGLAPGYGLRSHSGRVRTLYSSQLPELNDKVLDYSNTLNDRQYIVENADVLMPSGEMKAEAILEFSDTSDPAGYLLRKGKTRSALLSIPIEAITDSDRRTMLMTELLKYLDPKSR